MSSIVYYTNNRLDGKIAKMTQDLLSASGLPIISVSLQPMTFGENIVVDGKPSIITMMRQILVGLVLVDTKNVFLCEHDVLYHKSHFEFVPKEDNVYYYNTNVWRWAYLQDWFITYNSMISLSGVCARTEMLRNYFQNKLAYIYERGFEDGRNPFWARRLGHEPGKMFNEKVEERKSEHPNIDVRHSLCTTPQKMTLSSFRKQPKGWREGVFDKVITGWKREQLWT